MNFNLLYRLILCIFILSIFLYVYIAKQNAITKLRLEIPLIAKKVEMLEQENVRLQFEIDQFENPLNLMEISRRPQYCHLRHPLLNEIISIEVKKE